MYQYTEEEIQAVAQSLKIHFNNLSTAQTLTIAFDILRAIKKAQEIKDEQTNNNKSA
jgi:hypothetical protein